jgi:vancomycin resistance protein VanJ
VPRSDSAKRRRIDWGKIRGLLSRWLVRLVAVTGVAYPVCLGLAALLLGFVGESHWITTLGLYAPHIALALPLPFVALLLRRYRFRRLLLLQLLDLPILVFLVGFVFPWPTWADADKPVFRVMTFNVDAGHMGYDQIAAEILAANPDLVLAQEAYKDPGVLAEKLRVRYAHTAVLTQFVIASRFPILEEIDPARVPYRDRERSPRFMRYTVASPLGELGIYSVHPISPRGVLKLHRFRGILGRLRRGEFFEGDPNEEVGDNTGLRLAQARAIAELAGREQRPVVIAGDFNLHNLSPAFRRTFSAYTDAFQAAGWGLGYTYPSKNPWLRLDHVLVNSALRVTSVSVGCRGLSDHRCIVAEIQKR